MSLQDAIIGALPELRTQAASLMQDLFAAYSPPVPGEPLPTNEDGYEDPDALTPAGETYGKVSGSSAATRDTNARYVTIGGVDRPVVEGGLHIPLDAQLPAIGWEYECTTPGPASDPALLGRRYRVIDVPVKSYATARRLDVVDVTDLT